MTELQDAKKRAAARKKARNTPEHKAYKAERAKTKAAAQKRQRAYYAMSREQKKVHIVNLKRKKKLFELREIQAMEDHKKLLKSRHRKRVARNAAKLDDIIITGAEATVDTTKAANITLWQNPNADDTSDPYSGAKRVVRTFDGVENDKDLLLKSGIEFAAKTDIWWEAEATSGSGMAVSVDFELLLMDA